MSHLSDIEEKVLLAIAGQINASNYQDVENFHRDFGVAYKAAMEAYKRIKWREEEIAAWNKAYKAMSIFSHD